MRESMTASSPATSDLPTPPLPLTTPMTLRTFGCGFGASSSGAAFLLWLHPAQAGLVPHSLGAQPWFSSSDTEITPFDRAQTLL